MLFLLRCREITADFRHVMEQPWALLAHCILRSASALLLRQNYWHISSVHPEVFSQEETTPEYLSDLQPKRPIQQVSSYISPPPHIFGQTWCVLQGFWRVCLWGKQHIWDILFFFIWQPRMQSYFPGNFPLHRFPQNTFYTTLNEKRMTVIFHTAEYISRKHWNLNLRITAVI